MFNVITIDHFSLVAKILTFLFKIFDIEVQLENKHYFESDKPYVVIMNHQSSVDFMSMQYFVFLYVFLPF